MTEREASLRELLDMARLDSLPERESQVLALRYGLPDAKTNTLEEVGRRFGLTRERARQIVLRAHRLVVSKALSELRKGLTNQPCARLALFAREFVCPERENLGQRLAALITQEFPGLFPTAQVIRFVASLAYADLEPAKDDIDAALTVLREQHERRMKRELALDRFKKLVSYVNWPASPKRIDDEDMADMRRGDNESLTAIAGSFYSDKMSHSVNYRSELELNFYRFLEQIDEVVEYHERPFGLPYESEGRRIIYYPDLFILLRNRRGIVVEIMPVFRMALWRNLVTFDSLHNYCLKVGFGLLVTDGYGCLEQMRQYKVEQRYTREVMRNLRKRGTLDWNTYRAIRDKYHAKRNDFVGLVVRNKLVWQLWPFKLSLSNPETPANISAYRKSSSR
jgi:hypothetical protein